MCAYLYSTSKYSKAVHIRALNSITLIIKISFTKVQKLATIATISILWPLPFENYRFTVLPTMFFLIVVGGNVFIFQ